MANKEIEGPINHPCGHDTPAIVWSNLQAGHLAVRLWNLSLGQKAPGSKHDPWIETDDTFQVLRKLQH